MAATPLFEAPEFSFNILSQYEVVASNPDYAVMHRRDSATEPLIAWQDTARTGHWDQEIVLPQADAGHYVLLKVKMRRSFQGEIIGLFYKTTSPKIVFHLKDGTFANASLCPRDRRGRPACLTLRREHG